MYETEWGRKGEEEKPGLEANGEEEEPGLERRGGSDVTTKTKSPLKADLVKSLRLGKLLLPKI